MPQITFMSWNIQTFGDAMITRGDYTALCNFIAHVAFNQNVDVLAIMELRQLGVAHLPTLKASLNNVYGVNGVNGDWYYDSIKGAVRANINGAVINDHNDLNWDSDHHEGYAVFWNNSRHADFTMLGTRNAYSNGTLPAPPPDIPANVLSLVLEGRDQTQQDNPWFDAPAFNPAAPNADFPLDFLRSNPSVMFQNNAIQVERGGVRRPCYFVLNVQGRQAPNNNPANHLVPVLIYHCTSHKRSRRLNTQLAGYSRQLYQVDDNSLPANPNPNWININNAIIAGDFNIDANRRNQGELGGVAYDAYTVFTNNFVAKGANCQALLDVNSIDAAGNPNTPKTTVQLNWPLIGGTPINSINVDDYRRLAIDNIFYRTGGAVNLVAPNAAPVYEPVYDLLTALININGQIAPNLISNFTNWNIVFQQWQLFWRILYGRFFDDPNNFIHHLYYWQQLDPHEDARQAATFIRNYISDHLPVTIRLDFQ